MGRSCQCRNRQLLDSELASRLSLSLATMMGMLAWVSNLPRRWPLPFVVLSSQPRSMLSLLCVATGATRSVLLTPSPRGTGLVAAKIPKKVLAYAGVDDCFTSSRGATSTGGNFVKAVFAAVKATYGYNFPDLWEQGDLQAKKPPFQEFTDYLKTAEIKAPVVKTIF